MKKILLCSAAVAGVAFAAAPAMAQVDVTVGGYSKNYVGWMDQDEAPGSNVRDVDILRDSEIHFNAEGTADNGLTYGFHAEMKANTSDDDSSSGDIQESYLYLASSLGRVNIGAEDGANYLLQVAAPSADSNIDGLRQYVNPINISAFGVGAAGYVLAADGLDYDNDASGDAEKITYLSPNWAGFQFGLSYTPTVDRNSGTPIGATVGLNSPVGGFSDKNLEDQGSAYEGAVRYEGTFNNVGFALGGGYTFVEDENGGAVATDDENEWNVGADFDIGAFGLGAVYTETNSLGGIDGLDVNTVVVGGDYTTGPFQFGVSYMNKDADDVATINRYAGGVVYTLTQGLTLRGSVQYDDIDSDGPGDADATAVLGGIQFNF